MIPFENGLVKRKDVYSDSVTILRQLGLLVGWDARVAAYRRYRAVAQSSMTSAPTAVNGTRRTSAQPSQRSARLDDLAGVLPEAPEHHRRAGAGDRCADRAELRRGPTSSIERS